MSGGGCAPRRHTSPDVKGIWRMFSPLARSKILNSKRNKKIYMWKLEHADARAQYDRQSREKRRRAVPEVLFTPLPPDPIAMSATASTSSLYKRLIAVLPAWLPMQDKGHSSSEPTRAPPSVAPWPPSTCDRLASCVLANSNSQLGEDLVLLPTLVRATRGNPGVFVEYVASHVTVTSCLLDPVVWAGSRLP